VGLLGVDPGEDLVEQGAVRRDHTVSPAAVQGIEALRSGNIGVRSLQEWALVTAAGDTV
jgi:hypothetical protein